MAEPEQCGKPVGSKPWWMGVDQYDPCPCTREPDHDGLCECACGVTG